MVLTEIICNQCGCRGHALIHVATACVEQVELACGHDQSVEGWLALPPPYGFDDDGGLAFRPSCWPAQPQLQLA